MHMEYRGHIFFSDTVIYFNNMANFIINNKFKEKKENVDDEAKRIIEKLQQI